MTYASDAHLQQYNADRQRRLSIREILGDTFRVGTRRLLPLLALGLVIGGVSAALQHALGFDIDVNTLFRPAKFSVAQHVFSLLSVIVVAVVETVAIAAIVQELLGHRFSLASGAAATIARLGALVGVVLISYVAGTVGLLLLVVPGAIIGMMLFVAVPVCVTEKLGVVDSLSRSRALTKGHRWRIFGAFMAMIAIIAVPVSVLLGLAYFGKISNIGFAVADTLLAAPITVLHVALLAVVYDRLRKLEQRPV